MQINILSDTELAQLKQLVSDAEHIVICCHKSPDGDALGSSLGLASYLKMIGKESYVVIPDAYPDYLMWLPNSERIIRYDKRQELANVLFQDADLIFCLDFNSIDRVEVMGEALTASSAPKVLIDHHLGPLMDVTMAISFPDMSSTSELIFRIIWQMGGFEEMDKKCAVQLYCGMMTDTGGFTYNSTNPEIFFIISQLLTKNINKDKIFRNVYNNYSSWAIRLRGYILCQKLNVFDDFHASYFTITRQEMKDFHFIKGDAEGLVNIPLQIKGMKLSISLREDDRKENLIWVSLRSVDDFPCNKMAEEFFNGGGHLNASGGKLECSVREAEQIVRQAFLKYESILKGKNQTN